MAVAYENQTKKVKVERFNMMKKGVHLMAQKGELCSNARCGSSSLKPLGLKLVERQVNGGRKETKLLSLKMVRKATTPLPLTLLWTHFP